MIPRVALINEGCNHMASRFGAFVQTINGDYYHNSSDFEDLNYDFVFVEQGVKRDLSKTRGTILVCDAEDCPLHFTGGVGFESVKDRAIAYAKMVHRPNKLVSSLPQISLPIQQYLNVSPICDIGRPSRQLETGYFCGATTFIGRYNEKYPDGLKLEDNPKGDLRFLGVTCDGNFAFNQRYKWLLELREAGIKGEFGVVFGESNQSLEWQTEHFGNVQPFGCQRLNYDDHLRFCLTRKFLLNCTGYERISMRTFDIMSTGGVLLMTDFEDRIQLFLPKVFITVGDKDNVAKIYEKGANIEDFRENREILKNLTPEIVWRLFLRQL